MCGPKFVAGLDGDRDAEGRDRNANGKRCNADGVGRCFQDGKGASELRKRKTTRDGHVGAVMAEWKGCFGEADRRYNGDEEGQRVA